MATYATINKATGVYTPKDSVISPGTPSRTPSLLEQAQNQAADAAASRASAQREADSYAAKQRQLRIDAINTAYAPRIQREQVEGDSRLSRVAALNVRSGTIGSGVDTTKFGEQKTLNQKALQSIEDEKATAINEAFGYADQLARQRAEDTYNANKESADANLKKYQDRTATAFEALKVFGANDVTADKLKTADPKTYETLRDVSGMSDAQIDAYLKVNAPEGTYQWNAAEINGSTMYVPKVVNGKLVMDKLDLGYTPAAKGKEYKTAVKTDDGVLVIYGDGTYDLIGGKGGSGVTLKPGAPSWEEYLNAAQNASRMSFGPTARDELRAQYDREFTLTDVSDFTATEKKKLEQAGLLSATRKEQLDYLYSPDSGGGVDFNSAPE